MIMPYVNTGKTNQGYPIFVDRDTGYIRYVDTIGKELFVFEAKKRPTDELYTWCGPSPINDPTVMANCAGNVDLSHLGLTEEDVSMNV